MRLAIAFLFVISWMDQCSGYDYSSSCSRTYRSNRMQTSPDVPCDLNKQIYCVTPGTNYPWQAIRSFIRENQGLMKRMYGDERHITVLKAELENFIEDGDVEKVKKPSEFTEEILNAKIKYTKSQGRAMKVKPHFRPIQDKNKIHENETLSVKPLEHNVNSTKPKEDYNETEITNNETINDDKGVSYKTKLESIANIELNDLEPNIISLETVIKQTIESNSLYQNYFNDSSTETVLIIPKNDTETNATASTEKIDGADSTTETQLDETTTVNKEGWKPVSPNASTLPPTLLFSVHEKIDRVDTVIASDKKDEMKEKPVYPERPSVIKLGGENACETRRTLEAPFWANNTKNELLALVNMYPFEQYIHMETCVHEKKQMYCREGCRCEQQYRFHRLLAYDPRNECRGIFSDWFKFPACCVCKCYDVPVEFRARSPRVLHPQYDENIKRVIYEDVARDWYSTSLDEDADDLF